MSNTTIDQAETILHEEYTLLYGRPADHNIEPHQLISAVFKGTAEYIASLHKFKEGLHVVPPNYERLGLASFIYESRKLSFPTIEPLPSVVIAGFPDRSLPAPTKSVSWYNWNRNQATNAAVETPTSALGLINLVNTGKKVRMAGYGHSWSPIVATQEDTFEEVKLVRTEGLNRVLSTADDVLAKGNVTVETGVTIQALQDWLDTNKIKLTIASNVVLTEIHLVGVVSPACHGAGYKWGSVADFVMAVSIVNADGTLVTYTASSVDSLALPADLISTVQQLSPSAFNDYIATLGMLGAIYAITLQLVEASTLECTDSLIDVAVLSNPEQLQQQVESFDGWVEIFWIPGAKKAWLKTWKVSDQPPSDTLPPITPDAVVILYEWRQRKLLTGQTTATFEAVFMNLIYRATIFNAGIKDGQPITNYYTWYRGIHYQAELSKMRVEDTEYAFPIGTDYSVVTTAFAHLKKQIDATFFTQKYYPVDVTCEMRFTNGSNATLAHYPASVSNKWAHIEFLSYTVDSQGFLQKSWENFVQQVINGWQTLNVNPHWAKGWGTIDNIYSRLMETEYVKAYKATRQAIDPNKRFLSAKLALLFD